MSKLDPRYAKLHKEIYSRFLDELETSTVNEIMADPNCSEAVLLNARVEAEIKQRILESEFVTV